MRRLALLLIVLFAIPVFAQSAPQNSPASQKPGPENNYGITPAPKPGHPLDPDDVATLTGKNDNAASQQRQYAAPQFYYSYPTGGSQFSGGSVGNVFGQQPGMGLGFGNGFGTGFNNGFNNGFRNRNRRHHGINWNSGTYYNGYGYSNLNSSQFANVSTETGLFHLRGTRRPGFGPTFFGNRTPGFGVNNWRPNLWSGSGSTFQAPTGSLFSPGLQP